MAVLRRLDGVQFAINPYRTTVEFHQILQLNQSIKELTQTHGQYVRLFKKADNQFTAVLSQDPGFLLGESVWQHFECPDNLVYCESMPENAQAILVIVSAGKIVFDNVIALSQIDAELKQHIIDAEKYAVYIYGDVPIGMGNNNYEFIFKENQITSFNHLTEPLFIHLPINEHVQLLPLQLALKEHHLGKSSALEKASIFVIIAVAFSSWYAMFYLH